MARFVVRRVISMVLVLFAISIVTFLIFQKIPNGDPALRLAGRTSTPEQIAVSLEGQIDCRLQQRVPRAHERS